MAWRLKTSPWVASVMNAPKPVGNVGRLQSKHDARAQDHQTNAQKTSRQTRSRPAGDAEG
ncbi:hypothetical protein A0H81_01936 [Grifola frondosa]|uniref:Uncharacterized protein n=1 Tax=Grifola frondosa TaxID=5627 RepID=A0A1C7ML33_GRIFR|nr:hypothetical protein A0H81_01936 [Grifola frondosa]